jgi:trans-aconitate 2-methyltransferase
MNNWNADQYLKFVNERTRPCHDLAGRVSLSAVQRVIDLGCGPGNSTEVLASRWPEAELIGLDNSPEMIQTAHQSQPGRMGGL